MVDLEVDLGVRCTFQDILTGLVMNENRHDIHGVHHRASYCSETVIPLFFDVMSRSFTVALLCELEVALCLVTQSSQLRRHEFVRQDLIGWCALCREDKTYASCAMRGSLTMVEQSVAKTLLILLLVYRISNIVLDLRCKSCWTALC